jgi:lipid A ethanolaminephosphotransferase
MVPYAVFLILLPAAAILAIDITFQATGKYLLASLRLFVIAILVALAALYSNYNAIHRAGNLSSKYILFSLVPVNVLSSLINVVAKAGAPYFGPRGGEPDIEGRVATPGNLVVVLAIGESSRARNFSLYGYRRRDTNPVLGKVDGLHLLEGVARRGSTLNALPEILERDGARLPTVVSRLGIPTACYVNYTLYDNCASVGETRVSDCRHGGKCYDEDVIPLLERNLGTYESGYRFVVLHLGGGSHGPVYSDRHPPEFRRFRPMCDEADVGSQCTIEQLYNSYDNTILYADHVLGAIIGSLDRSRVPYVFIYVSDHGESLLEDGRLFHGMPPGIPLPAEQAQVPLIVKASVPISIVERAEYPQPQIFDTVLDLFSIETASFDAGGGFIRKRAEPMRDWSAAAAASNSR